ncbi:DUF58 domain-containing protein [Natronococcus sp. A-GB1]|uniref:DUF58 domain-containing protein n=1 Tax=Natronococcus sp. A-GB1 TaxID=3037648 RepID=UPI00241C2F5F|nr:DUF58 domain-containing protein [Natronococcus sp. A-GB1]MDG5760781.1 DUF58 domain-containing protein [Natronococcus sp. A-GB1]
MRLTSRGWGVVAVVAFGAVMSWQYGPRSLDAVVIPLVVVVVAGVLTTVRADRPRVRRAPVPEGFLGENRTVTVGIETDSSVAATVRDEISDGVAAADPSVETTLEGETELEYDLTLEERGEHRIGPLSIAVRDVFGLFERRFEYEETTTVLAYPRVYDLQNGTSRDLEILAGVAREANREEFDHLREYQRGDPLREVHWKSAAKRPDDELVVKEFAADETVGAAAVAAECTPGRDDELAAAVASVATYLLECEVRVGLTVGAEGHPPSTGRRHHRSLLRSLAVLEAEELDEQSRAEADVLVQADANGTTVVVEGHEIPFDRLRGADGRTAVDSRSDGNGSSNADAETDGSPGVAA